MNIGVLGYNKPHRKTQDILNKLFLQNRHNVTLIIQKWQDRIFKPIINFRFLEPERLLGIDLAQKYNFAFTLDSEYNKCDLYLIAGANLINVNNRVIINAHPGMLPEYRGLDAFKWSIWEGWSVGVTTHYINDRIDCGEMINQKAVNVEGGDTIHSLAYKVYQLELEMLIESIGGNIKERLPEIGEPRRRMPHNKEILLFQKFGSWKLKHL